MSGIAIITEACIEVKDRACVDVCPVQCIYEFDPATNALFAEDEAGSGVIENTHAADPDSIGNRPKDVEVLTKPFTLEQLRAAVTRSKAG